LDDGAQNNPSEVRIRISDFGFRYFYPSHLPDRSCQASILEFMSWDPDQVREWVRGTTLRTALERLSEKEHAEFLSEYGLLLGEAYPSRDRKKVFPCKRTFVVATRGGSPGRYFRRKR
jgi:trans-aconitate methyltransferase